MRHRASTTYSSRCAGDRFKLIWNPQAGTVNEFAVAYRVHRNAHFLGGTTQAEIEAAPAHVRKAYATFEKPPGFELYDLQEDPHEFRNLAENPDYAGTRRRLFAELTAWQKRIRDPLADKTLRDEFVESQVKRRDGSHRKRGFVWDYLEKFRAYRRGR